MPILAIDTSTIVSSVAVADEDKILAELTVQTRLTHSETLMPNIEGVLKLADTARRDLEAVAVSIGPGSFTGLRIGLAAAKAISYALSVPLIGVSTTEVLAWNYPVPNVNIVPIIDAQKGNVYSATYSWSTSEDGIIENTPIKVLSFDELLERVSKQKEDSVLLGDMAVKKALPKKQRGELGKNVLVAPIHTIMPRAATVAVAGLRKLKIGEVGSVMDMEPIYIRKSEAELLWEKRQRKIANE